MRAAFVKCGVGQRVQRRDPAVAANAQPLELAIEVAGIEHARVVIPAQQRVAQAGDEGAEKVFLGFLHASYSIITVTSSFISAAIRSRRPPSI